MNALSPGGLSADAAPPRVPAGRRSGRAMPTPGADTVQLMTEPDDEAAGQDGGSADGGGSDGGMNGVGLDSGGLDSGALVDGQPGSARPGGVMLDDSDDDGDDDGDGDAASHGWVADSHMQTRDGTSSAAMQLDPHDEAGSADLSPPISANAWPVNRSAEPGAEYPAPHPALQQGAAPPDRALAEGGLKQAVPQAAEATCGTAEQRRPDTSTDPRRIVGNGLQGPADDGTVMLHGERAMAGGANGGVPLHGQTSGAPPQGASATAATAATSARTSSYPANPGAPMGLAAGGAAGTAGASPWDRALPPLASGVGTAAAAAQQTFERFGIPAQLAGIEVLLSVQIGSHALPLRDLLSVEPGQLVPLDRMTSEPVDILVNGRPFARGEVVAIGDRFGVRLLDLVGMPDAG